jgi:hypothetical protein
MSTSLMKLRNWRFILVPFHEGLESFLVVFSRADHEWEATEDDTNDFEAGHDARDNSPVSKLLEVVV